MSIDYGSAKSLLEATFAKAESHLLKGSVPGISEQILPICEVLFRSHTQAYREVLLGCVIARIQDKRINIRQPYASQGPNSFSGRALDERVINPFLQEKRIPSSRGPYLSVFRRSVEFGVSTRDGLRDKEGYDALLTILAYVESISRNSELIRVLRYLLYKFILLREEASVPLTRLQRVSLEQYDSLVSKLLDTPSGGRFPVILVVATLTTIKEFFGLDWVIRWQGINVPDIVSGAGGDITIVDKGDILMAAEVTERPVDRTRVATTFNTKIAPTGIEDYLFFVKLSRVAVEAKRQAHQYFAQGHEVNFLEIKEWILMSLATVGKKGRAIFNRVLLELLDAPDVPKTLKVAWNEHIQKVISA
jgi:hypothetical protein